MAVDLANSEHGNGPRSPFCLSSPSTACFPLVDDGNNNNNNNNEVRHWPTASHLNRLESMALLEEKKKSPI